MEREQRATIKQRRRVADLLAIRDGCTRREPRHIEAAGAMSDKEVLNFLDSEIRTDIEPLKLRDQDVEEINPGGGGANLYDLAENIITNFLNKEGWDAEKISPLQWGACCLACGRVFRSGFRLEQKNCITNGNYQEINAQAVADAVPAWVALCLKYNKTPLIDDFCGFCGISEEYIRKRCDGVTLDEIPIYEKLRKIQENGLNKRILNPKENPVGAIFLQKAINGYNETQTIRHEYNNNSGKAAALPTFGSFDALEDKEKLI